MWRRRTISLSKLELDGIQREQPILEANALGSRVLAHYIYENKMFKKPAQ